MSGSTLGRAPRSSFAWSFVPELKVVRASASRSLLWSVVGIAKPHELLRHRTCWGLSSSSPGYGRHNAHWRGARKAKSLSCTAAVIPVLLLHARRHSCSKVVRADVYAWDFSLALPAESERALACALSCSTGAAIAHTAQETLPKSS